MNDEQDRRAAEDPKKGLAIGTTLLALLLIAAVMAYNALAEDASQNLAVQDGSSSSSAANATVALPDFTVTDADGTTISLRDLEGRPLVLNFWASTCGPCQSEMPHFQEAYERLNGQVGFAMIDIPGFNGETVERAERFLADNGYAFPVYYDTDGSASRALSLSSLPRTYFLDADGNVTASAAGALSASALQQGLETLGAS